MYSQIFCHRLPKCSTVHANNKISKKKHRGFEIIHQTMNMGPRCIAGFDYGTRPLEYAYMIEPVETALVNCRLLEEILIRGGNSRSAAKNLEAINKRE
ncbi:MAG: hypothetical protein QXM21_05690 [Candidatus Caldarchaeum sp.]